MEIIVQRKKDTSRSTPGTMIVNGGTPKSFELCTLEPSKINPFHPDHPAINAGRFKVILAPSSHFQEYEKVPHICDVPGRDHILIHPGCFPCDTEGCCMVGLSATDNAIWKSRAAFEKLMVELVKWSDIYITFKEAE